ncbi:MAG: helicase-associated domain-containing protein, partial [Actinomycetota bacterium]|nr:helicase-associated domain-containing protein [Actinomycetota bacterium]
GSVPVTKALATFDDDKLVALLGARPDLAAPPPSDFRALAIRAVMPASAMAAWRTLDRVCQQVLEAVLVIPPPHAPARLAAVIGPNVDPSDLERPLARLRDLALVVPDDGDDDDSLVVNTGLHQIRNPAGLGPPARALLKTALVGDLARIAAHLGVVPAKSTTETADAIARALAAPGCVVRLLDEAPPGVLELARRLADNPVQMAHGAYRGSSDSTPAGWLVNRGLAVPSDWSTVVMPGEVGMALRGGFLFPEFEPRPPALALQAAPASNGDDHGRDDAAGAAVAIRLVDDIVKTLDDWATAPPKMLKAGGIGVRDVRRAAKALDRPEVEVAKVIELAAIAGLAGFDRSSDVALPLPSYDEWLALEGPSRWAVLVSEWLRSHSHLSVAGAIDHSQKAIPPMLVRGGESSATVRRNLVLRLVGEAGGVVELSSLVSRAVWEAPAAWAGGPATPEMLVAWVLTEAELLGVIVGGMLTEAGRAVIEGRFDDATAAISRYAPKVTSEFVLQADLTAVATGALAPAVRTELDLMADVESTGAASVHRFSEQSLRRVFDAGRSIDDVQAFLQRHSTRGVPQPLTYMVSDIGRRVGHVRVGNATCYVRCDDASLVADVLRSKPTARLGLRSIAPTVLVSDASPGVVLESLRAAGYLPARESADGALVLSRPEPLRADLRFVPFDRRAARPPLGGSKELKEVVAKLRSAPVPTEPAPDEVFDEFDEFDEFAVDYDEYDDYIPRPSEIAKSAARIRYLLHLASEADWLVRVGYGSDGSERQLNLAPFEISDGEVKAVSFPSNDIETFRLERVRWARILTEAEEERLE